MQDKTWLTVEDIYEILNGSVPLDTIRAWIRSKKLPAYRPGKAYLVKREDFEKFIRESRTKPDEGS
jgi:excisionase family DNA binding protein